MQECIYQMNLDENTVLVAAACALGVSRVLRINQL